MRVTIRRKNVATTISVLECMPEAGVHRFVFSSTCATYGDPDRALTLGAGWGFSDGEVHNQPVFLAGGDLRAALARIGGFFTGHRAEDDMREELEAHLASRGGPLETIVSDEREQLLETGGG